MRRKRRDEISHRCMSGLGGCVALCPSRWGFGVLLGVGWGAGSFLLSPSPLESLTEKNRKKNYKCLQSTLSTVPLTLWMPNRHIKSRSSPCAVGRGGGCADSIVLLPLVLFLFDLYTQPHLLHPPQLRAHLAGACFSGGYLLPAPSQALPAQLLGAVGNAVRESARLHSGREMPAPIPCPPTCTLRPNFSFFVPPWGQQRAGKGRSRSPGRNAGPSVWLCGLWSLCVFLVGKPYRNPPGNTYVAIGFSSHL